MKPYVIALVALALLAVACGSAKATSKARSGKLQVDSTVAPITSIVANVAGDRAEVHGVIPEGQDSHTYEPKPSVASLFSKADVVFVNGLSLEDPTRDLAKRNIKSGGQVVELGSRVLSPSQYIYDFSFPRAGGKPNPHLWTSPPLAHQYAAVVADTLASADPTDASYYRANATAFEAKVDDLDHRFQQASDGMPPGNRKLLTYHDAYAYFAAHYGWQVIGAIQVSSFEDPTPKEVASLIDQIKKEKVPAIFGSEVFPSPVLAQIGREAGVKYVDTLRDDDLPGRPGDPDHSYLGLMKADFITMVSSLGGDASGLRAFNPSDVVRDKAVYPQ
jgi:ABC-type Zn uptake system ZnuABC Zn-binding protein ZnuA